jgi:SH3-like domain-containing protein
MSMKTRAALTAALLALGLPGTAAAVKVNEPLYVKAKNTRVMEGPSPQGNVVVILQPGEQVTWGGADAQNKQWHKVTAPGGKKGFVFQTNLSTTAPNMELVTDKDGKQRVDPKKFVASGAAVKALSPGAKQYGEGKQGDYAKAVADIQAVEALAKALKPKDLSDHAAKAGLFPVVGPSDTVAKNTATKAPASTKKGKK